MKLLIVTRERQEDQRFGLGKSMHNIMIELRKKGHHVDYFSLINWQNRDWEKLKKYELFFLKLFKILNLTPELSGAVAERWLQGRNAIKLARENDYTHVWFQDPWLALALLPQQLVSKTKFKWGISEHGLGSFIRAVGFDGLNVNQKTLNWFSQLERLLLRKANWVFCPSKTALNQLYMDLNVKYPQPHWSILFYGLPSITLKPYDEARIELNWPTGVCHVIAVGRESTVKRYEVLIQACAKAEKLINKTIQLVIIGAHGSEQLNRISEEIGLRSKPLYYITDNVDIFLSAADFYISTSEHESFGLANQEAIAAGLPSIITAGGAAVEVSGYGAWIVSGNSNTLAQAIAYFVENNQWRENWRTLAVAQKKQWPTWDKVIYECEKKLND